MKIRIVTTLLVVFVLVPVYVFAGLTSKYSDFELVQIIKDEGYSSVKKIRDGVIKIKINGQTFVLFNNEDGDLQAYYAIGNAKISYEDINTWNRTKRCSRAYLDSDKDPVLESDLLANGGLSKKHVTEFFRVFRISAKSFKKFIAEHDN